MPVFLRKAHTRKGLGQSEMTVVSFLRTSPKRFLKSVMCWRRGMFDQLEPTGVKVAEELSRSNGSTDGELVFTCIGDSDLYPSCANL